MLGDKCPKCGFVEKEKNENEKLEKKKPHKCDCKSLPYIKKPEHKND